MLRPVYSKRFGRDVRRIVRRGKNTEKLKKIIGMLIREEKLDERYKNHPLKGKYKDCHDCQVVGLHELI